MLLKGFKTAFDFTQLSDDWVRGNFSITEWRLKKDLEGIPTIGFEIKEINDLLLLQEVLNRVIQI